MENVYPSTHFACTAKLSDLSEYFKSYADLSKFTSVDDASLSKEVLIARKLNELINHKECSPKHLSELCSIDALSVDGEITPLELSAFTRFAMKSHRDCDIPVEANSLETIKAKIQYNIEPRIKQVDNVIPKPENEPTKKDVPLGEVLVFVRIYKPYSAALKLIHKKGDKLRCSHEIVALGSNLLSELRDKIMCANDDGLSLEIDDLKYKGTQDVKLEYPSGLIGIDETLYVDLRSTKAIDYSEVVMQWGVKKKIASFNSFPMDKIHMKDLKFRLGYPYIYQHQGNCEHVIIFSDVTLLKKNDLRCRDSYPYYRCINKHNSELCNICHAAVSDWVICECERLPHDRTFLCQDCFVSYNYLDGKKIGGFKAYPYYVKSLVNKCMPT